MPCSYTYCCLKQTTAPPTHKQVSTLQGLPCTETLLPGLKPVVSMSTASTHSSALSHLSLFLSHLRQSLFTTVTPSLNPCRNVMGNRFYQEELGPQALPNSNMHVVNISTANAECSDTANNRAAYRLWKKRKNLILLQAFCTNIQLLYCNWKGH